MEVLKKVFCAIVAAVFFVNTVSYADVLAVKNQSDVSSNTLAPESRLDPVNDPTLLDIMKLTATATQQESREDTGLREKAVPFTLPVSQSSYTPSTGTREYFPDIKPFKYEGPDAGNRLAFQWYDPNGTINGRPMKDVFRFSMAWWHAMKGEGADIFGWGTKKLPWLQNPDPMQRSRDTVDAAFELMTKLGIPYYAFHDRDVAPEATKPDGSIDVVQSEKNLREIAAYLKQKQDETGIRLLWGTANLFSNPRFMNGAATNPDLHVLLHSAAQVKAALEVTNELGGANYVLWGGREGYYSLINTCTDVELDNLAQFLRMVRDHAKKINFKGKLMIEPKAKEPTGHQYDYDAATVMNFLRKYGLQDDFYLNIEPNHATLAGHTGQHDLQVAADNGKFSGLDANSGVMPGAPQLGWDTDHFPGLADALEAMLVIDKIGGFKSGGVHFDAKAHRTSTDREDIFIAHALGMDSYVLAHIIAQSYLADPEVIEFLDQRYASYRTELGIRFKDGKLTLEEAAKLAAEIGEPAQKSGKLEFLQRKLQQHMILAPVNWLISQRNARKEYTHEAVDKVTLKTAPQELVRPGDEIVFDYRHKVIMGDTEFIPCWIKGKGHGDAVITTRHYLCRANKVGDRKYDYEFIRARSENLNYKEVAEAIKDRDLLRSLIKKSRPKEVKDGIARFVKHQNKGLIIATAILAGEEERMTVEKYPFLDEARKFLAENGFKSAASFENLLRWRQIMKINSPEIDIPEAGGIGIYLPAGKLQYENAETVLHEHFAKCGMSHADVDRMVTIYTKLKNQTPLEPAESELLERAKQLDYENRYGDLLNMDFNAQVAPEIETRRTEQIERLGLRNPGHVLSLGANVSTQGIIFTLVSGDGEEVVYSHQEAFNKDAYREFGAPQGYVESVNARNNERFVTNPLMIATAFQNSMKALGDYCKAKGINTSNIKVGAISVQQHMTVYLTEAAEKGFVAGIPILQQLRDGKYLTGPEGGMSPMWKDASTGEQGRKIIQLFGGNDKLRNATGSGFQERFPLGQIMKVRDDEPDVYNNTRWILNGAAYVAYLLTGKICPWDEGDGISSHLVNVRTKQWLPNLDEIVPGLSSKLPEIKPTDTIVGTLHDVWLEDLPGAKGMEIGNSSGDNPSGSVGFGLFDDTKVAISLGSSGVIEQIIDNLDKLNAALKGEPIGNIMGTPFGARMRLVCFQNGAQALTDMRDKYITDREAIAYLGRSGTTATQLGQMHADDRNKMISNAKWLIFEEILKETPAGNNGAMMILQNKKEAAVDIMYRPDQYFSIGISDFSVKNRAQVLRAAVEGQIYFLKWVADRIGLQVKEINLTGGEAKNASIRQMVADIFGVPVNVLAKNELWDTENVSLGAALTGLKAHNDAHGKESTGWGIVQKIVKFSGEPITPSKNAKVYKGQLPQFGKLVEDAMKETAIVATPFPKGIDETLLDLAAADVNAQNTVVFVAQEFASLERCKELFPHATFVQFNQALQIDSLPSILGDARYAGRKKVLVTLGLNNDNRMQKMIAENSGAFESVIPLNVGAELLCRLGSPEQKPFQKGILIMGLLASAIPNNVDTYKETRSYTILEALLNMVFEDKQITQEYIDNLVNPGNKISVLTRWGYLIGRLIGPIKQQAINVFTRIVNYFA